MHSSLPSSRRAIDFSSRQTCLEVQVWRYSGLVGRNSPRKLQPAPKAVGLKLMAFQPQKKAESIYVNIQVGSQKGRFPGLCASLCMVLMVSGESRYTAVN